MPNQKPKHPWADPNREGKSKDKQGERFCSKCGNSVTKFRILKSVNLCEFCVNEIQRKRDGVTSCRSCGKIAPEELKAHNGFCKLCVCPVCGKPDPDYVRKTGLCFHCAQTFKEFCRGCGKEAPAQIQQNKGWCDECARTRQAQKKFERKEKIYSTTKVIKKPGKKPATMNAGNPRATKETGRKPATMNAGNPRATKETGRKPATMNAGNPRVTKKPGKKPATMNAGIPRVTKEPGKKPATLNAGVPRVTKETGRKPATLNAGISRVTKEPGKKPATVNARIPRVSNKTGRKP